MRKFLIPQMVMTLSLVLGLVAFSANAEEEQATFHPGARHTGFYTALTMGELFFSGQDRAVFQDGWVVGLKAGYDFMKYAGAEGIIKFSGHDSNFRSPTAVSGSTPYSFFVFQYLLVAKGHIPVTRRLTVDLGLGGGLFDSHPNQLKNVGDAMRGQAYGELGVQYFTRIRGLSIGLDPSISGVQNLKSAVYQATGFVRYTF